MLQTMKEMQLEELMDLVVVIKLSATLVEVLDPVQTCILDLQWKTLLYSNAFYISKLITRLELLPHRCFLAEFDNSLGILSNQMS
jgi:hypothetical protein